jgi:hypothetical protein
VSKPSGSDTKVLSQLFPSVKKRSFSKVFDPAKECVAMPQQKKKAFRAKPSNVQVLMLDNPDEVFHVENTERRWLQMKELRSSSLEEVCQVWM